MIDIFEGDDYTVPVVIVDSEGNRKIPESIEWVWSTPRRVLLRDHANDPTAPYAIDLRNLQLQPNERSPARRTLEIRAVLESGEHSLLMHHVILEFRLIRKRIAA